MARKEAGKNGDKPKDEGKGSGKPRRTSSKDDGEGAKYEFKAPEFDEQEFIRKEVVSFRTTIVLMAWGLLAAGISLALYMAVGEVPTGWYVSLIVCAVFGVSLKWVLPAAKAQIGHWGRKEWIGHSLLFFFTWLALFLLFVNPPVSDQQPPYVSVHVTPEAQLPGGDMHVHAIYRDNRGVAEHSFTVQDADGGTVATEDDLEHLGNGHYTYNATVLPPGQYTVQAEAVDHAGHRTGPINATLRIDTDVIQPIVLRDQLETTRDEIVFHVDLPPERIRAVYLALEGSDRRIYMEHDTRRNEWEAYPDFAGWITGQNNFRVVAEEWNRFDGQRLVPGGIIVSSETYTVNHTTRTGSIDDHVPPPNPTEVPPRIIPGPGALLGIALLAGAALIARRRQDPPSKDL